MLLSAGSSIWPCALRRVGLPSSSEQTLCWQRSCRGCPPRTRTTLCRCLHVCARDASVQRTSCLFHPAVAVCRSARASKAETLPWTAGGGVATHRRCAAVGLLAPGRKHRTGHEYTHRHYGDRSVDFDSAFSLAAACAESDNNATMAVPSAATEPVLEIGVFYCNNARISRTMQHLGVDMCALRPPDLQEL